jgi:predicted naringenin-chalcone synthase
MSQDISTPVFLNDISFETPLLDFHARLAAYYETMAKQTSVSIGDRIRYNQLVRFMRTSGVEHRYSVLGTDNSDASFADFMAFQGNEDRLGENQRPSTAARMEKFKELAPPLAYRAIGKLLARYDPERITHLIVVSCTGLYSPFLDADIIRHFQLSKNLKRTIIGFMGCHGAFNAMSVARDIVKSEPTSRVLVVAIELCSLHRQNPFAQHIMEEFQSKAVTNSLFGDACGAALISAEQTGLHMVNFTSHHFPEYRHLLTWNIGEAGFEMGLGKELARQIPNLFKDGIILDPIDVSEWVIHAGGPKIIEGVGKGLRLWEHQLARSYDVLRSVGNTSSTSILRNLQGILEMPPGTSRRKVCAVGIGPGIQIEVGRFVAC